MKMAENHELSDALQRFVALLKNLKKTSDYFINMLHYTKVLDDEHKDKLRLFRIAS